MENKEYTIGGRVFTMPPVTLGKMQDIQKLLPKNIMAIEDNRAFVSELVSVVNTKLTDILAIILVEKVEKKQYPVSFFTELNDVNNTAIQEAVSDFFLLYDPISFCWRNVISWSKSFTSLLKEKSGDENKLDKSPVS